MAQVTSLAAILIALPAASGAELQVLVSTAMRGALDNVRETDKRHRLDHGDEQIRSWGSVHRSGGALRGGRGGMGEVRHDLGGKAPEALAAPGATARATAVDEDVTGADRA